jgi:hypothetical protein
LDGIELIGIEHLLGGVPERLAGSRDDMAPRALVGIQHPERIERPATVSIPYEVCTRHACVQWPEHASEGLRSHV